MVKNYNNNSNNSKYSKDFTRTVETVLLKTIFGPEKVIRASNSNQTLQLPENCNTEQSKQNLNNVINQSNAKTSPLDRFVALVIAATLSKHQEISSEQLSQELGATFAAILDAFNKKGISDGQKNDIMYGVAAEHDTTTLAEFASSLKKESGIGLEEGLGIDPERGLEINITKYPIVQTAEIGKGSKHEERLSLLAEPSDDQKTPSAQSAQDTKAKIKSFFPFAGKGK